MKTYKLPESIDISSCILWQYNNAARLQSIVRMLQDGVSLCSIDLWKKAFYAFDLDRPISESDSDYQYRLHGLQALSILFGIDRPTWDDGEDSGMLGVDAWRRYIKGMIWLMDSNGSCDDINRWLAMMFPNRVSFVLDNENMTITYKFYPVPDAGTDDWKLIHVERFLPHPAGVKSTINLVNTDSVLGLGIVGEPGSGQDGTTAIDGTNVKFGRLNNSRFGEPEPEEGDQS